MDVVRIYCIIFWWYHFYLAKFGFWCNVHWNIILKVKEWLQNLGIGEHTAMAQDDDEGDDETVPLHTEETHESAKDRWSPMWNSCGALYDWNMLLCGLNIL